MRIKGYFKLYMMWYLKKIKIEIYFKHSKHYRQFIFFSIIVFIFILFVFLYASKHNILNYQIHLYSKGNMNENKILIITPYSLIPKEPVFNAWM